MNAISDRHVIVELQRLRSENERLRQRLRESGRHAKRLQRAYDAALALANLHISYLPTTREQAQVAGLTQRQFENGRALLQLARVVNGRRWQIHDLATIENRLRAAQDRALAAPEVFFARLPRHARR